MRLFEYKKKRNRVIFASDGPSGGASSGGHSAGEGFLGSLRSSDFSGLVGRRLKEASCLAKRCSQLTALAFGELEIGAAPPRVLVAFYKKKKAAERPASTKSTNEN